MRKTIVIGMGLLLVLAAALLVLPEVLNKEPKYRGKRLSEWFRQYYRVHDDVYTDEIDRAEASRALRAIGTNAVPWLVARCFDVKPDSRLRSTVQPAVHRALHLPRYLTDEDIAEAAFAVLTDLHPPAEVLLPLVTNRLHDPNPVNRQTAISLLGYVGPQAEAAVPWLRQFLQRTNEHVYAAVQSLSGLGTDATAALPELITLLQEPKPRQVNPVWSPDDLWETVGNCGAAASNAIPALRALLATETNEWEHAIIAVALCRIDAGQTDVFETLLAGARNPTNNAVEIFSLGAIGPNAKRAVPLLAEIFQREVTNDWESAADALLSLGETNLVFDAMVQRLDSPQSRTRIEAALYLIQNDPSHSLAISNLVTGIHDPEYQFPAMIELLKLHPVPPVAIPALRAVAANRTNMFRRHAARVLDAVNYDAAQALKAR